MDLDCVEMVVKVENTFGIKIPVLEIEKVRAVGDFHNVVWLHLQHSATDRCKSQMLFYKLRKAVELAFNFAPQQLKPDISPEIVFPKLNWRKEYFRLADETNLELPELKLRAPWSTLLISFGCVTIPGGFVAVFIINRFYDNCWLYFVPVLHHIQGYGRC